MAAMARFAMRRVEGPPRRTYNDLMRHILITSILVATTAVVYWPVGQFDFVNFDDPSYVSENPVVLKGITIETVNAALTKSYVGMWLPLTMLSYQLEARFLGADAAVFHTTNAVLHAINGVLLYALLLQMTARMGLSAMAALLFLVHPMHVESVAWISERKDVLSAMFWFLATIAYVRFARTRSRSAYGLTLLLFLLGLLAKPMLVTLPFTLVLWDYWPLNRIATVDQLKARFIEKIPLFALAALFVAAAFSSQYASRATVATDTLSAGIRIQNAVVTYGTYVAKAIVPVNLAAYYPYPRNGHGWPSVTIATVLVVAVSAGCIAYARQAPYVVSGWYFFAGTLLPVIGIVQIGGQAMADRYTYIPYVGLFVGAIWGADAFRRRARVNSAMAAFALAAGIVTFTIAARGQVRTWQNSETLFLHAARVAGPNHMAQTYLAKHYYDLGRYEEAFSRAEESLRIRAENPFAHDVLGMVHLQRGNPKAALAQFQQAAAIHAGDARAPALQRLAVAHQALGDFEAAERLYRESIEQAEAGGAVPDESFAGLLHVLIETGRAEDALRIAPDFIALRPESGDLRLEAGNAAVRLDDPKRAERYFREALEISPTLVSAWINLGNLLARQGVLADAIACYAQALVLEPESILAHENLSRAYEQIGNGEQSRIHAAKAAYLASRGIRGTVRVR